MKIARLEEIRAELKINKTQFAELMGISPHYYYQILSGQGSTNLRLEHLENLLTNKGVNPTWIITGEGDRFISTTEKVVTDTHITKESPVIKKAKVMKDVMAFTELPAIPGDLTYSLLEGVVEKMLEGNEKLLTDYPLGIRSLSLAWLSMLELAQQLIGQDIEFEYHGVKYTFRPA